MRLLLATSEKRDMNFDARTTRGNTTRGALAENDINLGR
jgi:hypothetical protein